jgi:ankyrin repeat protein
VEELDTQDYDGFTALHLAVKAVSTAENIRAVKALLIKGASREIKDKKGKTALDLVETLNNARLQRQLTKILSPPSKMTCL